MVCGVSEVHPDRHAEQVNSGKKLIFQAIDIAVRICLTNQKMRELPRDTSSSAELYY